MDDAFLHSTEYHVPVVKFPNSLIQLTYYIDLQIGFPSQSYIMINTEILNCLQGGCYNLIDF